MFDGLVLVTPPSANPVSVADAIAHSRALNGADDNLIAGYILSATLHCEFNAKRAFMPQTWQYSIDHWPGRSAYVGIRQTSNVSEYYRWNYFEIPLPPLQPPLVSFNYYDTQLNEYQMVLGADAASGNYLLNTLAEPARVTLPFSGIWPTIILATISPIQLVYNCGYGQYSGMVDIDNTGLVTLLSGTEFDDTLIGTWITIGQSSYNVGAVVASDELKVYPPSAAFPITPASDVTYSANNVPMPIRHAILFLAAHFYENREPILTGRSITAIEVPGTVDALLANYRIVLGVGATDPDY
jgi:hypothetical protein